MGAGGRGEYNCTGTARGHGIVTMNEECDDSNKVDGDGCSATCAVESTGTGGGGNGGGGAGGNSTGGNGTGGTSTGGNSTGGNSTGGNGEGANGTGGAVAAEGGCGCDVPGKSDSTSPWAALLVLAGLATTRLRRRR